MSVDTRIGTELRGYRIETLVGRGGMGTVYLAEHLRLKRKVALKLLSPELSDDERFRARFLRESELAASLDHPNVIPIHDAGEADGLLYIAMRYVEGDDLRAALDREGRLEPGRALALVRQIAGALDAAHARGLVHRDVKPANVLLDGDHAYLCDFGLTKMVSSISGLTGTGQFIGTIDYVAPEQIQGNPVDGRADLYSLACLLYESLTGVVPFKRDSEVAVLWAHVQAPPPAASAGRPELPAALDAVLAKALAKTPEERHPTCVEFVRAAAHALGVARPAAVPAPSTQRRRAALFLAPVALLAVAALVGVLLLAGGEDGSAPPAVRVVPNSVAVIDPNTNELVAAIPVGAVPGPVAVGLDAVWVGNTGDNTISRIDPRTRRVVKTIGVPGKPLDLVVAGGSVWVLTDFGDDVAKLVQIDPDAGSATTIELGESPDFGLGPGSVLRDWSSLGGDAAAVWAMNPVEATLMHVDAATGSVSQTKVPAVAPQRGGHVTSSSETAKLNFPVSLAVGDGDVWSAWYAPGAVTNRVVRTAGETSKTAASIPFAGNPDAVATGAGAVWVAERAEGSVWRIDPAVNLVTNRIAVPRTPFGLAVAEGAVWVASSNGTVSRIDPTTNEIVETIKLGGESVIYGSAGYSVAISRPHTLAAGAGAIWLSVR